MKYQYRCSECMFEEVIEQSIKDEPIEICSNCGKPTFFRVIGKVAGYGFRKNEGQKKG